MASLAKSVEQSSTLEQRCFREQSALRSFSKALGPTRIQRAEGTLPSAEASIRAHVATDEQMNLLFAICSPHRAPRQYSQVGELWLIGGCGRNGRAGASTRSPAPWKSEPVTVAPRKCEITSFELSSWQLLIRVAPPSSANPIVVLPETGCGDLKCYDS